MSLDEIESKLPNGFHDAKIVSIFRDLRAERVDVHLEILVGLPDDAPQEQNKMTPAVLRFTGVKILIIEQPDVDSSFVSHEDVSFLLTEDEPDSLPADLLLKLRSEFHTYTFFIQDWYSNIRLAARALEFFWT